MCNQLSRSLARQLRWSREQEQQQQQQQQEQQEQQQLQQVTGCMGPLAPPLVSGVELVGREALDERPPRVNAFVLLRPIFRRACSRDAAPSTRAKPGATGGGPLPQGLVRCPMWGPLRRPPGGSRPPSIERHSGAGQQQPADGVSVSSAFELPDIFATSAGKVLLGSLSEYKEGRGPPGASGAPPGSGGP
ncbi:hypothetical protein Efla_002447 [Eimeria flavescens]